MGQGTEHLLEPGSAGAVRTPWQRVTEPIIDRSLPPDVLRRNRLTGRFTLLNFLANIAFFLNDLLTIGDPLIVGVDIAAMPFFGWVHWRYVRGGDQRSTALLLLSSLNIWLFFNASYYGQHSLFFFFLFMLILITFFLISFKERGKLIFFMALPVFALVVLEATDYGWFTNAALTPPMVEQTRLLSMVTNLLLLFIFMEGIVRNTQDIERRLLSKQERLSEMADRLQELNELKENYNVTLQTQLGHALVEVREKERALDHAALQGEERERARIAQELHDGVGAMLSSLKHRLGDFRELVTEEHRSEYAHAMALIDGACEEVRQASHSMQPLLFKELGLVNVLADLVARINSRHSLRVDLQHVNYSARSGEDEERALYRIILELLNNALRHAQATRITIQLMTREGNAVLTVEDDGVGYDPARITPGLGLKGMQHRVDALRGTLHVESAAGRGTITVVEIPVNEQQQQ
ncbi:MAG: sensor histidine kinase [Flavobacteriales bacterium]|nr:sensor histidine kinase [Flavobacteriales bacterium]